METKAKIGKKILSMFLAVLMMVSAFAVGFNGLAFDANAATGTVASVQAALTDEVALEIITKGDISEKNIYTLIGSAAAVNAVAEIYAYIDSIKNVGAFTNDRNSTAGLLKVASQNLGMTTGNKYTALQYIIDPPGDVISGYETVTPVKGGECNGCDHKGSYNSCPTAACVKTVEVYTDVNGLLEQYGSLSAIPASMLQGIKIEYAMAQAQWNEDRNEHKSGCDTVYDCYGYKCNFLVSMRKTEIKNMATVEELKNFETALKSDEFNMTFDEMMALDAAELMEIYDANYGMYEAMINKYSWDIIHNLYGSYNDYFDNLLNAVEIHLAIPAVDVLIENTGKAYDNQNLAEMQALEAVVLQAYRTVINFKTDVLTYIKGMDEYKDLDMNAVIAYAEQLNKDISYLVLPGIKTELDAFLAENAYAVADPTSTGDVATDILQGILSRAKALKSRIDGYDLAVVTDIIGASKQELVNFIDALTAKLDLRLETENAFKDFFNRYEVIINADFAETDSADLMSWYDGYDDIVTEVTDKYDALVKEYGATVVDPLFSVTIGEGGSPALLQTVLASVKTTALNNMQAVMVARLTAQLESAKGVADVHTTVTFNNFSVVGTALKQVDTALLAFCQAEAHNWVTGNVATLYNSYASLLSAYNTFTDNLYNKGFTQEHYHDGNGNYVTREDTDKDIIKNEDFTVNQTMLNGTVAKFDAFLASDTFTELLGLTDAEGNTVDIGGYIEGMIADLLFNDDIINMLVGMLFPMIEDLLTNQIGGLLAGLAGDGPVEYSDRINPHLPSADAYIPLNTLADQVEDGGLFLFLGENSSYYQPSDYKHANFPTLLKNLGLSVYPAHLADAMASAGAISTSSDVYKALKEAGTTWTAFGVFDPYSESFTYDLSFEWGVTDKASFINVLGGVLQAVQPLLPTLFGSTTFSKTLGSDSAPAAYAYGSALAKVLVEISISNKHFTASLPIEIQGLNLYGNVIQPLFQMLGLTANASISSSMTGKQAVEAILNPVFELLDKVVAAPVATVLDLLPRLAYLLSTDFIDKKLQSLALDLTLSLEVNKCSDSTAGTLLGLLGDIEVMNESLSVTELLGANSLSDMLGVNISDINALIGMIFGDSMEIPKIDQRRLIACAKWNGPTSLTVDKDEVLWFLLDYAISVVGSGFIADMLGGDAEEGEEDILATILGAVEKSANENSAEVIAALVELLNPVEYELDAFTWAEGTTVEETPYLQYMTDWKKEDSQYIIDNAMSILETVLKSQNAEITDISAYLEETVDGLLAGLFTNATITSLVEMLAGIGELDEMVNDILVDQLGVNLGAWANDYGYLFDETLEAPEAKMIYVDAVKDDEGNITWGGLVDGDKTAFIYTLCEILKPAETAIAFLLGGKDLSLFDVVTLKGYESFDSTLGVLLGDVLGITLPRVDFANNAMNSLANVLDAVFSWLEATLKSDDLVAVAIDLIADLLFYIESNGLSVFVKNLLAPVLVLVDVVRPLINVDINTILSVIVSDLIAGNSLDLNKILALVFGTFEGELGITVNVDINDLKLSRLLVIVDSMFGTDLVHSSLVEVGLKGICNKDLDTADALTIILATLIDCVDDAAADPTKTNLQAILEYLELDAEMIELVAIILNVIKGVDVELSDIDWAYMYNVTEKDKLATEGFPAVEFKYLDYSTDWTETEAETVYEILDDVIDTLLPDLLEGKTIAGLVNGILEDNVYSQDVFASLVEMIINAVADFTFALEAADVILDLDTTAWLDMCELVDGKYVVKAGELDVTDAESFVAAAKKFIAPANNLLAWLFFGEDITLFDGSEDAALIKLTGGHGYAYGIAPILEALGLEMKVESEYLVNGKYDVAAAVGDILTAVLGLVDDIASSEFIVDYVFDLLPNLIYFVNAGGLKTSVNNLLAPLTGLLGAGIGDLIVEGYTDVNSLLASFIELPEWLDVTDLSMDTVFALLDTLEINGNKLVLSDDVIYAIENIYGVGEAKPYTAATGKTAYRVAVNGYDVLTVLLSLAIEVFTTNNAIFADLLGADVYALIINAVKGANVVLTDINWAYMYDGDMDKLAAEGFPAPSFGYLDYTTDWTEEAAAGVYNALDDVADMFLPALLEEMGAENVADLVNGILEDNVYSTEILGSVVEMIVNALGNFKFALEAVDVVLDVDTLAWFDMCTLVDGEYVFDAEKYAVTDRESFISTLEEILAPANGLLAWFFFGENYTFFNGADGEALITLNGGKGYAYGLAPIFEALGLEMKVESEYLVNGKYDVAAAVADILNAALDLVDGMTTSASVVEFAFDLIPNLLYFISADGLKTSVNNLIAPAAGLLAIPGVADALANILEVEDASSVAALINNFIELPVDITDLSFDTVIGLLDLVEIEGKKIVLTEDMTDALENIYAIGEAEAYTAATGKTAYRVDVEGYDVLTVLLSFAIDAFKVNGEIFADLLGEEEYAAIIELIKGAKDAFVYATPDWDYMGAELNETGDTYLPAYDKDSIVAKYYLKYGSDWTEETAAIVIESLDTIVQAFFEENESLGKLTADAIANGLYQEDLLHSLIEMVVELIYDYGSLIEEAGAIFGIGAITEWFNYCEITTDEDGNLVDVTVTKDFGIDSAEGAAKAEAFVNAFVEVLAPAYEVLEWVFFANDITLFNGVDGSALITVTGGKGYEYGLVPLFEALGATMPGKAYENGKSGIKSVAEFEAEAAAEGKEFMEVALYNVFSALTGWLADICGDLAAADEYGVITAMLDRLPNFIYNLNAGTLDVIVNNLLLPVEEVLQHLDAFGVELDIKAMLADLGVTELNWYGVFALVEDLVNLYWPAEVQDFLANLYLGKLVAFESANGKTAYRVALTTEAPEGYLNTTAADVLTIILSFVLDGILDERNAPQLSDWLGEDIYAVIYKYLSGDIEKAEYVDINWLHTDKVGKGPISPVNWAESQFGALYNDVYTKDMGNYINFWLPSFVDTMITLIGINKNDGSGDIYSSLEDMLDSLIGTSIYTVDNVYALLNTITGLIDSLKAELGEAAFYAIADVLNAALGVDVTHWDNYEVTEFATGDRDAFVAELLEMLEPIYPILAWLLTGEDLIALFDVSTKGDEDTRALVIEGAEGYAKGIIPLLEAFDYDSDLILTPDAYAAAADGDAKTLLANIVNPLLNVVDTILADPVNEIFNVLPGLLYFVNSGGLDAVIKNTANAVFTVLANIEPLVGEIDIYDLIGLYDIEGIEKGANGELVLDINTILTVLLADLEESTGFEFKDLAMDAVVELTVGEVVEFTSKNGETAYTMVYANGADRADMATVVLRAALTFISIPENAAALEVMLEGELSAEGYDFVCALLENFSSMAADEDGIYEIMYTVYQIFYAANVAAHEVDGWLDDFNGDYSFLNDLFETSEVGFMQQIRVSLGSLLDKYTGDIIDGDELAPNGFVRFFQQIADFFKKIGDWFKNLFS